MNFAGTNWFGRGEHHDPAKRPVNPITPKEWLNIALGGVAGFCLVYFATHSVVASSVAGIPCGMGGVALGLLLLRTLCPGLYFMEISNARVTKRAITGGGLGMLVITAVGFIAFPSAISRFVIVALDLFVIANFIGNRLQNKTGEHGSADNNHVA